MTLLTTDRWRAWIIERAPVPMLTHAYEVVVAVALLIIGAFLLAGEVNPQSVSGQVNWLVREGWAWGIFVGAGSTLWGLFRMRPRYEWAGQLILGWSTFFYSLAVLAGPPFSQGGAAGLVFLSLAIVGWWRAFKITSQSYIQKRLTEAARAAHMRVRRDREGDGGRAGA